MLLNKQYPTHYVTPIITDVSEVCPDNFDYLAGFNCYQRIATDMTYQAHLDNCRTLNTELVSIETLQEWAMMKPWVVATGKSHHG